MKKLKSRNREWVGPAERAASGARILLTPLVKVLGGCLVALILIGVHQPKCEAHQRA